MDLPVLSDKNSENQHAGRIFDLQWLQFALSNVVLVCKNEQHLSSARIPHNKPIRHKVKKSFSASTSRRKLNHFELQTCRMFGEFVQLFSVKVENQSISMTILIGSLKPMLLHVLFYAISFVLARDAFAAFCSSGRRFPMQIAIAEIGECWYRIDFAYIFSKIRPRQRQMPFQPNNVRVTTNRVWINSLVFVLRVEVPL